MNIICSILYQFNQCGNGSSDFHTSDIEQDFQASKINNKSRLLLGTRNYTDNQLLSKNVYTFQCESAAGYGFNTVLQV